MPRQIRSALVAVLFLSTAVIADRFALANPELDRHAKSAKQCTDELRKNQTALAATGESASAFFHRCWWQSSAEKPTPLLSAPGKAKATLEEADAAKAQDAANAAKAEAEKAKASAEAAVARAKEQTAMAEAEIAKAKAETLKAKEDAAREAAKAREAAAAEAAAKSEALDQAQAAKAQEAAKARAATKQQEAAAADAAAKARAAAEVAAATKALDAAKTQAAAKVQAAAKALDAAKAQAANTATARTQDAHADRPPATKSTLASRPREIVGSRQATRPEAVNGSRIEAAHPRILAAAELQRARKIPRAALFARGPARGAPIELRGTPPRRLRPATFESAAVFESVPRPEAPAAAASPVVSMVKVHIQGLQKPIMWPVFPEFVPAFREFANHPIVPGFTSAP